MTRLLKAASNSKYRAALAVGYGAGLLAGALGHVYVLGKAIGFKRDDRTFYADITGMVWLLPRRWEPSALSLRCSSGR